MKSEIHEILNDYLVITENSFEKAIKQEQLSKISEELNKLFTERIKNEEFA